MEQSERDALCEVALEGAMAAGARYAEVRLVERQREMIDYKDGGIDVSASYRDLGIGIRALGAEGWGYGATSLLNRAGVARASQAAVAAASATSDAVPSPASTMIGTDARDLMRLRLCGFLIPSPEPIGAASGITAAQPTSSSLRAITGSSFV